MKRRIRSPHPGVKLNSRTLPSGHKQWRARFIDPDTGKQTDVTLDPVALRTAEARRLWATRKSETLAKRSMDLASGAPVKGETPVDRAVESFYESCLDRLRPSTVDTYRHRVERFRRWADDQGIRHTEDITPANLAAFRVALVAGDKQSVARGQRRGARKPSGTKRRAATTNSYFTSTKIALYHWRKLGLCPALSRDAISDVLKPLPQGREQPDYLAPAQLDKLLHAALRHDAAVFAATREEHAGLRPLGSTRRYEAIAPFAAFLLLTGCRRGEALGLKWLDVDLDAKDHEGRAVGEIRLRGEHTKTHRARTIGLEVSPALRAMLAAMKLRAGRNADGQHVFGGTRPYTADLVEAARKRLIGEFGAPAFDWQGLRSTCATFFTNAPGIFGAATAYMSAKQLGHSVTVAERHYTGLIRGIPKDAHTLESAMQIEATMRQVIATATGVAHLTSGGEVAR